MTASRRSPTGIAAHLGITKRPAAGAPAGAKRKPARTPSIPFGGRRRPNSAIPPTPLDIHNGLAPRRGFNNGARKGPRS
jgi:hypothetical protein